MGLFGTLFKSQYKAGASRHTYVEYHNIVWEQILRSLRRPPRIE